MEKPNREHKSSLFTNYFNNKERLIEAYNAIAGTDFPPTANVEFKTLENVLFRSQINDIAFMLEDRFIVMLEHQSTPVSENIAIRLLIYVTDVLKGIVSQRALYEKKPHKIPTPEFFVIYNGAAKFPDKAVFHLSDAFISPVEAPSLELVVTVFNVAKGHNEELLTHCTPLSDYSVFISRINDNMAKGFDLEDAIDGAIHYCIEHDIMRVYLQKESAEVRRLLITEWNEDEYREVIREEAREEGLEEGRAEGVAQEKLANARLMKAEGIPVDAIARITGLSPEDVSGL